MPDHSPLPWRIEMNDQIHPKGFLLGTYKIPVIVDANGNPVIGGQSDWYKAEISLADAELIVAAVNPPPASTPPPPDPEARTKDR